MNVTEKKALSKAADYRFLIAEAKPDVEDVLADEFSQAFASMLSLKGDSVLAWSLHDDFLGHDTTSNHPKASFLSLNLHVLAKQLERIELSERLFIDADLLPLKELVCDDEQIARNPTPMKSSEPTKLNAELEKLLDSFDSLDDDQASQLQPHQPISSSLSDSKVLDDDDFDSWLDTL